MTLSILERRRIEAEFAKGIFTTLAEEVGHDRARDILAKAVLKLARAAGESYAAQVPTPGPDGRPDLLAFADTLAFWTMDDALRLDFQVREANRLHFNVTRCRYAEMYRDLGMAELGGVLSCVRDGAFCQGFNPKIRLTRTQTIMDGASHCDLRYELNEDTAPEQPETGGKNP